MAKKILKAKVRRKLRRVAPAYRPAEIDAAQYLQLVPQEAACLSRNGLAWGIEVARWGTENHSAQVARANDWAVQLLLKSEESRQYLNPEKDKPWVGREYGCRVAYLEARSWHPWRTLEGSQLDYLLSLLWIPEEPMSPLEALAQAMRDS